MGQVVQRAGATRTSGAAEAILTLVPGHSAADPRPEGVIDGFDGAGTPGLWLRQRRRAAGLTQEELAARSGLGVRTISDLERGARSPYPRSLRLVTGALGMSETAADEMVAWYRA